MSQYLPQMHILTHLGEIGAQVPNWLACPELEKRLQAVGYKLIEAFYYEDHLAGINRMYPARQFATIGSKLTDDDVVGLEIEPTSFNTRLLQFHNFASPGWEAPLYFATLEEWLTLAREDYEFWLGSSP